VAGHPRFFPMAATKLAEQRSERCYSQTSSPISRVGSCPFGTISHSPTRAPQKRRFQPVKASESFCVLVAYTDPQKVIGASEEPKAMRFAVQPNG
jgi:hypothetical protein